MNNDYPYIRAWGRLLGSSDYYVEDQIAKAKREQAPYDAIFKTEGEDWSTFSELLETADPVVIEQVNRLIIDMGLEPMDKRYNRYMTCDWCGVKKPVRITTSGTTHYNRVICKECEECIVIGLLVTLK